MFDLSGSMTFEIPELTAEQKARINATLDKMLAGYPTGPFVFVSANPKIPVPSRPTPDNPTEYSATPLDPAMVARFAKLFESDWDK